MARSNRATKAKRSKRDECDLDLNQRIEAIDFEVEIKTEAQWIEVDIEIANFEIDLNVDASHLQPDASAVTSALGSNDGVVGASTPVDADIVSRLVGFGSVTVAFGSAKVASGLESDPDAALASETMCADASGADLVLVFNNTTSSSFEGETPHRTSVSTTTYVAIDFDGFDFSEGQIEVDFYDEMNVVTEEESTAE
jgi:hypothetical protein